MNTDSMRWCVGSLLALALGGCSGGDTTDAAMDTGGTDALIDTPINMDTAADTTVPPDVVLQELVPDALICLVPSGKTRP